MIAGKLLLTSVIATGLTLCGITAAHAQQMYGITTTQHCLAHGGHVVPDHRSFNRGGYECVGGRDGYDGVVIRDSGGM
jgi:hypothetical protein